MYLRVEDVEVFRSSFSFHLVLTAVALTTSKPADLFGEINR